MADKKIAYLILAHESPAGVFRLINKLQSPRSVFFIHVDLKTNLAPFITGAPDNVLFIKKRARINWGSYRMVQATINGLTEICDSKYDIGRIVLLSETTYPLMAIGSISHFFDNNEPVNFVTVNTAPQWPDGEIRVKSIYLDNFNFKGRYLLQRILNWLLPQRIIPSNLTIAGGSQWFAITREAAAYCIEFVKHNPAFCRLFKYSWAPDESFFQTILYNSPLKATIVSDDLLYTDWSEHKASPKILTLADAERILSSGKLFARKFPMKDDGIIALIDEKTASN
ncbi:beta-1,6-N-acetylglucosaminyltransferase [Mucilaginibacter sp. RS28]|uniref:Peptide O-xylosyltransferase n=1 Tax=Mucilaginibacter straminoryzae TaxID=2932774 RepID=A0A9X1X563_9SPHI|nr:beta-1,6-N-acetylglucosaminyltransferase [Mucilaginibacter straminoryzae]MCJ8211372.1 beta-1,6-N-acetylglucosaminyltransferase [Mucilaginibacter straminoryzae]